MKCKILSVILSMCIFGAAIPLSVSAKENAKNEVRSGETTFIVSLDTPALIDFVNASNGRYKKVNEYLFTDEGRKMNDLLSEYREAVKTIAADAVPSADLSESRSFSAVANGFTVRADMSDFETLKNLTGVKSVEISGGTKMEKRTALKITSEDDYGENEKLKAGKAYTESVNAQEAYDAGYTGKNMLIAVIDSEFDLKNIVFSYAPKEPAYDKKFVKAINDISKFNISDNSIDDIFCNGKIIYAYDYGENDTDCANDMIYHGTHVSGIAAGNSGGKGQFDYKGTAYDAQLALFKISDEDLNLSDDAIIAALDDAIKMGPDVINCSFGSRKFLMYDYEGKSLFERLSDSGVNIVCAAGNDGVNSYSLGVDEIPADYITYGALCTPSSADGILSVAASVPEMYYSNKTRMIFNDVKEFKTKVANIETDTTDESEFTALKKRKEDDPEFDEQPVSYEENKYIFIDGTGTENELKDMDFKGRSVILNNGDQPLKDVIKRIEKHGGQGLIIIDDGSMKYSSSDDISSVSVYVIDSSAREYFLKHPKGYYSIEMMNTFDMIPDARADEICEFSSAGVREDLTLKPDVTAPGNNILSAGYNNEYQILSGTSMASPCMSGAAAIVKQYVREKGLSKNMSALAEEELVYKLIMSTARLAEYHDNSGASYQTLYYTPRKQGAGIVNAGGAVTTPVYLEVEGARPSVSLKEIKDNKFSFDVTLINISDKAVTYKPDIALQTDGYELKEDKITHKKKLINTLEPVYIKDKAAVYFSESSITVAPKSKKIVTVKVQLSNKFVESNMMVFRNGFFADGFVIFNTDDAVQLSLPFTGFCGDWSSGQIFSDNVYDGGKNFPYYKGTLAAAMLVSHNDIVSRRLGENSLGYDGLPSEISFSSDALGKYLYDDFDSSYSPSVLLPDFYLLRDAADFTVSLEDTGGNILYYQNFGGVASNINSNYSQVVQFSDTLYEKFIRDYETICKDLFPQKYKYTLTASTVSPNGNPGRTESRSFDIRFDNTAPTMPVCYLEKTADGRIYLNAEAFDDGYLQGIELFALSLDSRGYVIDKMNILDDYRDYADKKMNIRPIEYSYDEDSGKYSFVFDVTDYEKFISYCKNYYEVYEDDVVTITFEKDDKYKNMNGHVFGIGALDYAYNTSDMMVFDVRSYGSCRLTFENDNGSLASGITVSVNGVNYMTDSKGVIELAGLPIKNNYLSLSNSGYEFTDGFITSSFKLSEQEYNADKVYTVHKRSVSGLTPVLITDEAAEDEPSESTEISKASGDDTSYTSESTDNEKSKASDARPKLDTGDDEPKVFISVMIFLSALVSLTVFRKKSRNEV